MTISLYNLNDEPIKGATFTFSVALTSQADTDIFKTDPTLAAGDIVIYKDGVLDGNIDALPADIGSSGIIPVVLSADEMTADRVDVLFHDADGSEWQDLLVTVFTKVAVAAGTSDYAGGAITGNITGNLSGSVGSISSAGITALLTTAMTESYSTDGSAPTIAQAFFEILQFLQERTVSSTTVTVKKRDGSTTAMTFTLDDATTPTAITRAT